MFNLFTQVNVQVNKGKDFNQETVEVSIKSEPGTYFAMGATNYDMYRMGATTFLTEHKVSIRLACIVLNLLYLLIYTIV